MLSYDSKKERKKARTIQSIIKLFSDDMLQEEGMVRLLTPHLIEKRKIVDRINPASWCDERQNNNKC